MPNFISEDQIEQAILQKLQQQFGYELLNCFTADADDLNDQSNRNDKRDVIFEDRLKEAAVRLNPTIPEAAIDVALAQLTGKRHAMSPIAANREIDSLIRDGIPVEFENSDGIKEQDRVRVIGFKNQDENRFLAVSQLWIKGEIYFRRPDILLYVNGIPLVFIELKNSNVKLKTAFDDNLTNYKNDIPQFFLTNAFCILSNAIETKVGSFTAGWEHFFNWLRVEDEKEKVDRKKIRQEGTSLENAVAGVCAPGKLIDYVENFVIFYMENQKIIAMNHQFIGVNRAYQMFQERKALQGKLGVFWHTQGSGKSFSMIFYSRKIFRKLTGNFTFVVITDRNDIIVIVDEAHRTQYKSLAENMRQGLPNAQYLAFTGTPLLGRARKTNAWFGDYVSEYNFQQSTDEGATRPLFYKKRVPEVLIQNDDLSDEFYQILEDENLDDVQQAKLEKKFSREIEVIKRDDRLETIAGDIVYHFPRTRNGGRSELS